MSLTAKTFDSKGKAVGETKLPEAVFGVKRNDAIIFEAVHAQRASVRQGTAKTKTRSEVRGGGKKPFKQKGTGSARQGSTRSSIMVGGGRAFGPKPRNYAYRISGKARALALRVALSQAQRDGKIFVAKDLKIAAPKTKAVAEMFLGMNVQKGLFVDSTNEIFARSVRNLARAKYLDVNGLNVFDVLKYENVILSSAAITMLESRLSA